MRGRCGTSRRVLRGTLAQQNTAHFGGNRCFRKTGKIHRQNTTTKSHWRKITAKNHPEHPQTATTPWVLAPPPRSRIATFGVSQPPSSINAPTLTPKQSTFLTFKPRLPLLLAVPASPALVISPLAFGASRLRRNPCRKMAAKSIKLPPAASTSTISSSPPPPCFLRLSFFP